MILKCNKCLVGVVTSSQLTAASRPTSQETVVVTSKTSILVARALPSGVVGMEQEAMVENERLV